LNTKERHQQITHLKTKNHSIHMLCSLFEVSQSAYFSSLKTQKSPREIRRENLKTKIISIFTQHKKRYGRPRIFRQLRDQGEQISEKMVGRLMRSEGLEARKKRCFRPQTTQNIARSKYSLNLLKDSAAPSAPNEVVVTDITYVATKEGWLYLAGVMDLQSKTIKGYEIRETMHTELISKALEKAIKHYPNLKGAIHHSDRGCQYTSEQYLQQLKDYQLQSSMSAKGNCYDNAAMESFWSTLKTEAFPESGVFESKERARQEIFEYIEGYYHTQRMHSSLNYLTPLAAETVAKQAA
jgi:transposase InsO family protein